MSRKKFIVILGSILVLLGVWLGLNPRGRFGWSFYAFTTYNSFPRLVSDIQIRADGEVRRVTKTHDISRESLEWLLNPRPEILIIAIGWDGVAKPRPEAESIKDCQLHILKNEAARKLYNELKKAGKRVAIHFHSTC